MHFPERNFLITVSQKMFIGLRLTTKQHWSRLWFGAKTGDTPLPEQMMARFTEAYMVPQASIDPSHKSNNASDKYTTMHHFAHMCTFLLQNGALWDMELGHCGISGTGLLGNFYLVRDIPSSITLHRHHAPPPPPPPPPPLFFSTSALIRNFKYSLY